MRVDGVLLGALAVAFVLRVWGLAYGLPYVYNPDEMSILSRALSLADKGLNPGNFVYPSLYFYLLAGAAGTTFAFQWLTGQVASLQEFQRTFWQDPGTLYLVGRSISVAAGVATVAGTYALAQRLGSRAIARTSALLMAVAYFPVRDAHMIKHDVLATLGFVLVVLAAHRMWLHGRTSDSVAGGILAGACFALHYYGVVAAVPLAAAVALQARSLGAFVRSHGLWVAAGAFVLTFAALSPYVLLDLDTAMRDIAGNRQIIVDRARATFGPFGSGLEQLRLMATQGAGWVLSLAALAGTVVLARRSRTEAVWLLAFPLTFLLLLSQTWPYGRLQNGLYPFLAVTAAIFINAVQNRWGRPAALLITAACALQPLWQDVLIDRLMTREDTRTLAKDWIEANISEGDSIAVQPYSVPLEPTREWLASTLAASGVPAGPRARGWLARNPYPTPGYRLFYLGDGGLDRDKRFLALEAALAQPGLRALRAEGISHVVLKRLSANEPDPLRDRVSHEATLVYRAWPFASESTSALAQLPDHDIRPTLGTTRPGPVIEVWRLLPASHDR